jgi:type I restriction enzyme S subunit
MGKYPHFTIGEICNIEKGETGIASATPGDYPLVNTSAARKSCDTYQFDTEAVCIPLVSSTGHGKKTLNYVHYQKGKFALGTILAAVIPKEPHKLSAAFLHRYLQFNKDWKIVPLMKGAANVSLAIKDIAKIEVPVPPINEQTSFIGLFNKLNDSSTKLQDEFSTQSFYLALLRQAILQEAIEGKLTADWRKKHPELIGGKNHASKLLEKIKAEKERLIKERKIKKDKPLPPITNEEKPFDLQEGWIWTRLGETIIYSDNMDIQKKLSTNTIINYVDIDSIDNKQHKITQIKTKKVLELSSRARRVLKKGYIVYSTVRPYLKNIAFVEEDMEHFIGSTGFNVFKSVLIDQRYIFNLLLSPYINKLYQKMMIGFNSPSITNVQFENTIIPLPSLDEQRAIVERVDKLMIMIDKLEKQVTERKDKSERLMQSVLREAFESKA